MGVVYIWKHSEGVVSDAVACILVTITFSNYLFVGGSDGLSISMQLFVTPFFSSRTLYLYCTIVCRVPMISIWREVRSWSRFAWYSHGYFDRATFVPPYVSIREHVHFSMGVIHPYDIAIAKIYNQQLYINRMHIRN